MNKQTAIPVAFICDDNYALPTAVAITSMKLSKLKATKYDIYILGRNLSDDNKRRIFSLNEEDFSVTLLEKSFNEKQSQIVQVRERITPTAALKFELPNVFPEIDKLIYLDSDTLIQKDLTELYNIDLGDCYAGVVNDAITLWGEEHRKWLHLENDIYFNTGVLLLNLKKMREDSISEKLLDYRLSGNNYFMDQDALNVVFSNKIRLIPCKYNLLNCFFSWHSVKEMEILYNTEFPNLVEFIFQDAVILHFGDEMKPWRHFMGEYLSAIYNSVYQHSPYADIPLILEGDPLALSKENCSKLEIEVIEQEKIIKEKEQIIIEQAQIVAERNQWYEDIKKSVSFRIGRIITWLPRKIRDVIRRYRDSGFHLL